MSKWPTWATDWLLGCALGALLGASCNEWACNGLAPIQIAPVARVEDPCTRECLPPRECGRDGDCLVEAVLRCHTCMRLSEK